MSDANGNIDPTAGLFVVQITYNPVNKEMQLQFKPEDHLIAMGMMEMAKAALIRQQVAQAAGPQLVVPRPRVIPS